VDTEGRQVNLWVSIDRNMLKVHLAEPFKRTFERIPIYRAGTVYRSRLSVEHS
jgi:hypothetical protein